LRSVSRCLSSAASAGDRDGHRDGGADRGLFLVVGGLVYRKLTWRLILRRFAVGAASGTITMMLGFAMIFGYLIATQGLPMAFATGCVRRTSGGVLWIRR
jgi:TRAP-type C4-dicarboxylate transport system permease large subunit